MDELRFKLNKEEISEEEFIRKIRILQDKSKEIIPTHNPEKNNRSRWEEGHRCSALSVNWPYDSTDPELIKYHIKLAEEAG